MEKQYVLIMTDRRDGRVCATWGPLSEEVAREKCHQYREEEKAMRPMIAYFNIHELENLPD